ncbi:MAG: primosomal protein N', partial [Chitinophagaceae bacterium]
EHESSYKQYDPAPRYQARDSAIYLASLYKAKVLLGSATPSIESYQNALQGKYGLVTLTERFGNIEMPEHEVVSMSEATKKKTLKAYFTEELIKQIGDAVDRQQQVILFQNRRGYSTILLCATCGYTSRCVNCDVSLTYHKASGMLHCHYCGYHQTIVRQCPACGSAHMVQKGFGTERIEEELALIFPDMKILRLDLDSTRTRNAMQQIINSFQEKRADVLIGTQMVAKGLDFDNVALIGVVNADSLLNYPDFRAFERSFQLLTQVSGRAGRRKDRGKVVIQAYDPDHRILRYVTENNYRDMFDEELKERQAFNYPPFSRLISIDVKSKEEVTVHNAAVEFARRLRMVMGDMV